MPFYRVVETIPPEPGAFDVVIVDEASQSGPDALFLHYLGKKCIIVGDDQQISPDFVGIDQDKVQLLIRRYLDDFDLKNTFDVGFSLFDHADIRYGGRIVLREHFRCMPEIIRFSNDLCYSANPLVSLRQYPPQRPEPIVVCHVPNGFREGGSQAARNLPEAEALVEAVVRSCGDPANRGKTMGVISLQGEYQARVIRRVLVDRLGEEEIEERELVCGDAYAFQGDERDIIFMSMVAAPNERIGALAKESDKRRFNVAASRARDQVWLFHTATLNDLSQQDMRYKLLSYYLNPEKRVFGTPDWSKCESDFERDVGHRIDDRGYRVIPQYEPLGPGRKRIDFVVEGTKTRLALECDGDYWHGPEEYEKDMFRQRQLQRSGLVFWRIRGSEFYYNREKALEPLWKILHEMEIYRVSQEPISGTSELARIPDSRSNKKINAGYATKKKEAQEVELIKDTLSSHGHEPQRDEQIGLLGAIHIDEIRQDEIRAALCACIPEAEAVEREKLLRKAASRLGFTKLGRRIRRRLNRAIGAEVRAGRLMTDRVKVWKVPPRLI